MPVPNANTALPQPPTLRDEIVELRLVRMIGPTDAEARPGMGRFCTPECRFAIHRRTDDQPVGHILLRITQHTAVLRTLGHIEFAVDEAHQRGGFAARAVRLMTRFAPVYDLSPLWILLAADNLAARRTVERAGFSLVDVVDTPAGARAFALPPQLCRYRWVFHDNPRP